MDDTRVLIVRTTTNCTLDCGYCYVRDKGPAKIDLDCVERLIEQSACLPESTLAFVWHGGEPLLMGLRFFETVVALQRRYPKHFINAVQTNGIGLDGRFARFFKDNGFHVSVSVDIPPARHDARRRLKNGGGSFERVASALPRLAAHDLPVAVLAVVSDLDVPPEAYVDFVEAYGLDSLALNLEFDLGRSPDDAGGARYARLLYSLYRHAAQSERGFTLREAEPVIADIRHLPAGHCWHLPRLCGYSHAAVAENGDVFICCDKFIDSPWPFAKLGNIATATLSDMFTSSRFADTMAELSGLRARCTHGCAIGRFCRGACIHDALMTPSPDQRQRQIGCLARCEFVDAVHKDFEASAEM
ncbi:radical SAM protein [Xanthobacteraceae bacterium Astr-EGSB]|uniref:radical SAM protein n=1 Tax=Astrobacterium formosum TaxID=3069710 RepID=UPI0027B08CE0|nr:radical SAM protein [Xanthobacteraceae bacterium Astr-EGSB]